jgi:hypothetical protein
VVVSVASGGPVVKGQLDLKPSPSQDSSIRLLTFTDYTYTCNFW